MSDSWIPWRTNRKLSGLVIDAPISQRAVALRRQRSQFRILSGAPHRQLTSERKPKLRTEPVRASPTTANHAFGHRTNCVLRK
jgi:hypothetical protein